MGQVGCFDKPQAQGLSNIGNILFGFDYYYITNIDK